MTRRLGSWLPLNWMCLCLFLGPWAVRTCRAFVSLPSRTSRCPLQSSLRREERVRFISPAAAATDNDLSAKLHPKEPSSPPLILPSQTTTGRPVRSVAAPMVAASDFAYRALCRQYGVDLTFTQMLHAHKLVQKTPAARVFQKTHCDFYECHNLDRREALDNVVVPCANWADYTTGPLVIQLAGHDADTVVEAAQWIVAHTEGRLAGIDLNCGCPQQIAKKGGYGAFLVEGDNGRQAARILKALRQALPENVAVSTKCRLPVQLHALPDRLLRLQDTGIDFITVHGRNLRENKTLSGPASTAALRQAVELLDIPVVANGGVEFQRDVQRVCRETGAAAIMSSEGLLERPDLFVAAMDQEDDDLMGDDSKGEARARRILERQFRIARDYLAWAQLYPPLPGVTGQLGGSFIMVRGHLYKFLHRYWQEQPDLRDRLGTRDRLLSIPDAQVIVDELYERYQYLDDAALAELTSAQPGASWYRRHWKANRVISTTQSRHVREETAPLSIQERKALLQTRISHLREQRQERSVTSLLPKQADRMSS